MVIVSGRCQSVSSEGAPLSTLEYLMRYVILLFECIGNGRQINKYISIQDIMKFFSKVV